VPDELDLARVGVGLLEADLVERELAVLVDAALRRQVAAALVVVDLEHAVAAPHDPVDHADRAVAALAVERELQPLLDRHGLAVGERVVRAVEVLEAARAAVLVEVRSVLGAHDRDLVVPCPRPVLAEAVEHLRQARRPAVARDVVVQALEDLVDALSHERFHALGVDLDVVDVAVAELARAVLERRKPRVTVVGHLPPGGPTQYGDGCRHASTV